MFGVDLTGQGHELILVPRSFQLHQILGVQRYVPAILLLMEEILPDHYHAYVTVMTASHEQVAHLLRIDAIEQIVEDHEARSLPLRVAKFLGDALVIPYVCPQTCQLSRRNGSCLAIAPDYAACKRRSVHRVSRFCRKRMQKDDLPDPLGPLLMYVKGLLNLRSSNIGEGGREVFIPADVTTI